MEKRYESDMTLREKRELEMKKLKSMTFGQKLGYLWEYYKIWLVILAAVIMIISIFVTMYRNSQKIDLISIGIANSSITSDSTEVVDELIEMLGTGDKHETATVDTSYYFNDDVTSTDPTWWAAVVSHCLLRSAGAVTLWGQSKHPLPTMHSGLF